MGIDCPDVHQVIHWGAPDDEEMYFQETGRAGRHGALSCALLFHGRGDLGKKRTSEVMIKYCINPDKYCRKKNYFLTLMEMKILKVKDVVVVTCS